MTISWVAEASRIQGWVGVDRLQDFVLVLDLYIAQHKPVPLHRETSDGSRRQLDEGGLPTGNLLTSLTSREGRVTLNFSTDHTLKPARHNIQGHLLQIIIPASSFLYYCRVELVHPPQKPLCRQNMHLMPMT
jgi:hypothetical protein